MDNVTLYIAIAVAVAVLLFFFLSKKGKAPEAPPPQQGAEPKRVEHQPATRTAREALERDDRDEADEQPVAKRREPAPDKAPGPPSSQRRARPEPEPGVAEPRAIPAERDLSGLRHGLAKSRSNEGFFGRLRTLFAGKKELSPELIEQLEEVLLSSDVGVATTAAILERLRGQFSAGALKDEAQVWQALRAEAHRLLDIEGTGAGLDLSHSPTVVLFVGVNGAGKTTTIGKLATKLRSRGKSCVLAAGDTFRAAAVQQLVVWGQRVGCEVVRGKDGADPGSVIFDAVKKAQELNADVVLADTAGRLHTKSNLMAEMAKIVRTTAKALDGAPHEILLVIDATNGQNALAQAKEFRDTLELTGIVLTKLDGTAKGGVLLGISDSLKLPVRFIGLGERPDDLHEFVADDFIEALLGREG